MSDDLERCYAAAMRILQYRFNSEAELHRKLTRKGFERPMIDATIVKLRGEGWVDDERFAGAWVRTRTQMRLGPHRIRRELRAAGGGGDDAAAAIAANVSEEQQREHLLAACTKRFRVLIRRNGEEYAATDDCRNKLTMWLLKQGYDAALVHDVVKEMKVAHHHRDS